jgi:hypothetical protein
LRAEFPLLAMIILGVVALLVLVAVLAQFVQPRRQPRAAQAGAEGAQSAARRRNMADSRPFQPAAAGTVARVVPAPANPNPPQGRPDAQKPHGWLVLAGGRSAVILNLPFRIGSGRANDLVIEHPSLMETHARVIFDSGANELCIEDGAGGQALLLVNGGPTRKSILTAGDRLTLGEATLIFHDTAPGDLARTAG